MTINGKTVSIVNSAVSYESGISWKSMNKRMEAIDYGMDTDHLSAKISVWGSVTEINEFRDAMPKISKPIWINFNQGEKPFGPAFNCEGKNKYLLIDVDDIATTNKDIAQMSFQVASLWEWAKAPWAYGDIKFVLSNFAVQDIKRESAESKSVSQKESGWAAFRHGWSRSEFTLSLLADSQTMGGAIRRLVANRDAHIPIGCSSSMLLVDSQSENARFLSFGNLRRLGNSGFWQADFHFARVA